MCVCVSSMYSNLTSDINLDHIQSMSCSKSGRTRLRLTVLAGLKHGGATKWIVPIITDFNCIVRSQGIASKMHLQFLTAVILRIHNFWCVMLCRCVIHSRTFRTAGSHASNKRRSHNLISKSLESSLFLHFILLVSHILVILYRHFSFDSIAVRKSS